MKNILTFDVEEWFHANFCEDIKNYSCNGSNFRRNMDRILELCNIHGCKATFFVLGYIGENYRDVVEAITREGHDIASHGYGHQLAYNQDCREFAEDVKKSVEIIESITGKKVLGYRAPSWSIVKKNIQYLKILESLGIKYDASIFPIKTFLYGIPDAPRELHKPVVNGRELDLYELPTSVFNVAGRRMGYSGGFYFRLFPQFFIRRCIKQTNKCSLPSVVYLHPREIDVSEQRLRLPLKEGLIHYYNVGGTFKKLDRIMKEFEFTSVRDYIEEQQGKSFYS